jgi:hypothetical protein
LNWTLCDVFTPRSHLVVPSSLPSSHHSGMCHLIFSLSPLLYETLLFLQNYNEEKLFSCHHASDAPKLHSDNEIKQRGPISSAAIYSSELANMSENFILKCIVILNILIRLDILHNNEFVKGGYKNGSCQIFFQMSLGTPDLFSPFLCLPPIDAINELCCRRCRRRSRCRRWRWRRRRRQILSVAAAKKRGGG